MSQHLGPYTKNVREEPKAVICHKLHEARVTKWLSFNQMNFYELPNGTYQLRALKHLYISGCKLSGELPLEIGQLKHLMSVDASFNSFTSIPDNFFQNLKVLEIFDVGKNRLSSIPYSIEAAQNLRELCAANNNLVALPHSISSLRCLQVLDTSFNYIRSLQGEMFEGSMSLTLSILKLNNNVLDLLPRQLGCLNNLKELDVSNNQLYTLPVQTENLKTLRSFKFSGNKWPILNEASNGGKDVGSAYGRNAYKMLHMLVNSVAN